MWPAAVMDANGKVPNSDERPEPGHGRPEVRRNPVCRASEPSGGTITSRTSSIHRTLATDDVIAGLAYSS